MVMISRACGRCYIAKRACDRGTPCSRCTRLGLACDLAPPLSLEHGDDSIVPSRPTLSRPPVASLQERVLNTMLHVYNANCLVMAAIPAVPLAVPWDVLQRHVQSNGRVAAAALVPSSDSVHDASVSDAQDAFVEATHAMLAHSSVPVMHAVYNAPTEYDLSCSTLLTAKSLYANAAWLLTIGVRNFVPFDAAPDMTGPLPLHICEPALRLLVALHAFRPLSMAMASHAEVQRAALTLPGADLMRVCADGVLLIPTPGDLPHNIIAQACQRVYFQCFAEILLGERRTPMASISTELEFAPIPPSTVPCVSAEGMEARARSLRDLAALAEAHPGVAAIFRHAPCWRSYRMRVDEKLHLSFNGLGVLSSVTVAYANAHALPPSPVEMLPQESSAPTPPSVPAGYVPALELALHGDALDEGAVEFQLDEGEPRVWDETTVHRSTIAPLGPVGARV